MPQEGTRRAVGERRLKATSRGTKTEREGRSTEQAPGDSLHPLSTPFCPPRSAAPWTVRCHTSPGILVRLGRFPAIPA
jgi:hypothetical protein